ncbi:MAG: transglutaminase-like domain-containing protein [Candidatus Bathyarchaeia archaeon]
MSITYENKPSGTEVWSLTDDDRAIGLFMNNSWQTVYLANSSFPIEKTEEDNDGNSVAYLSLPKAKISPGENLSYQVVYKVVLKPRSTPEISENISETLDSISEGLKNQYCAMEGPWQVNNSMLRELAYEIVGDETNVLTIVKEIILWIDENVDDRTLEIPRYPNETYHEKAGDCDDQANLLITLCRIIGIPAYLQLGCIYLPNYNENSILWNNHLFINLTWIGWHGWAIVYIPPWGWLPVDLTFVEGNLSEEPLNAIKTSAIMSHPTVQYANVIRTDYVAESRIFRSFLRIHEFYLYEHDVMKQEEKLNEKSEDAISSLQLNMAPLIMVSRFVCPSKKFEVMVNIYK